MQKAFRKISIKDFLFDEETRSEMKIQRNASEIYSNFACLENFHKEAYKASMFEIF